MNKFNILILALNLLFIYGCEDKVVTEYIENPTVVQAINTEDRLGPNLIINGSFEEGHNLGDNTWGVFAEIPGWKADLSANNAPIEIQNGYNIGGLAPFDGSSKLELDSHNLHGFSASDVTIYQDIITQPNQKYYLTFQYSPRIINNQITNRAEVYWNNKLIATLNAELVYWQTYVLIVWSEESISRLTFVAPIDNDTVGGYLDDIRLQLDLLEIEVNI